MKFDRNFRFLNLVTEDSSKLVTGIRNRTPKSSHVTCRNRSKVASRLTRTLRNFDSWIEKVFTGQALKEYRSIPWYSSTSTGLRTWPPHASCAPVGKSETIRTVPSGDEATGTNDGANTDALKTITDLLKGSTKRTWADVVKDEVSQRIRD